jgi:hypothetical protein
MMRIKQLKIKALIDDEIRLKRAEELELLRKEKAAQVRARRSPRETFSSKMNSVSRVIQYNRLMISLFPREGPLLRKRKR